MSTVLFTATIGTVDDKEFDVVLESSDRPVVGDILYFDFKEGHEEYYCSARVVRVVMQCKANGRDATDHLMAPFLTVDAVEICSRCDEPGHWTDDCPILSATPAPASPIPPDHV